MVLAYSELIKNFENIRDYMREFYVYGFKNRTEVGNKSARSYDDERRRIESWLGDYMSFTQSASGRAQFISVDSREVIHNPLFKAFKAKSFTDNVVLLHFCLLDLLQEDEWLALDEIIDRLHRNYFDCMEHEITIDRRTVGIRLDWYVQEGIFLKKKDGRKNVYCKSEDAIDLLSWIDAINYFSEVNPMGIIGSFLLDKADIQQKGEYFGYKHHYMLYAMDSQILANLLDAMMERCFVEVRTVGKKHRENYKIVYPIRIYISTQTGREYLLCHEIGGAKIAFYRLDNIRSVAKKHVAEHWREYEEIYLAEKPYLWGVIAGTKKDLVHLEMTVHVGEQETFIVQRLEREKRNGTVYQLSNDTYKYVVDTFDAMELMPWIRTFIGRIEKLESSNPVIKRMFKKDLNTLYSMYLGGGSHDL